MPLEKIVKNVCLLLENELNVHLVYCVSNGDYKEKILKLVLTKLYTLLSVIVLHIIECAKKTEIVVSIIVKRCYTVILRKTNLIMYIKEEITVVHAESQ